MYIMHCMQIALGIQTFPLLREEEDESSSSKLNLELKYTMPKLNKARISARFFLFRILLSLIFISLFKKYYKCSIRFFISCPVWLLLLRLETRCCLTKPVLV